MLKENQENGPDEGSQKPLYSRTPLIYLAYCSSYFKFNHYAHARLPRFRSILFNASFVALLEMESTHTATCQPGAWRNIGLQDVPVINVIVNETRSYQSEARSTKETIYAVTPANIYVLSGDSSWQVFNSMPIDREITCFPIVTKQGQKLICESRYGIIQSSPLGSEWQFLSEGFGPNHSIISLGVSRSHPQIMYTVLAFDEPKPGDDELVKSVDGGETWFRIETLPRVEYFISLHDVYVDPKHSNIVYITMDDAGVPWVFKSVDDGATWESVKHRDSVDEATNLLIDPVNPNTIYFTGGTVHRRGIYKSTDGLKTYHLKISIDHLYTLTLHPQNRMHLYATAFPHSVLESRDAGETWSSIETDSLKESVVLSLGVNSQSTVYVGTEHSGVFVRELPRTKLSSFYGPKKGVISVSRNKSN